jgi:hypothetical protein
LHRQPYGLDRRWGKKQTLKSLSKTYQDDNRPVVSIADELSKLAKLKAQGVITEAEFSQMKSNLMKRV